LAALDEALRLDEEFAAALHNRALIHARLGQATEAQQDRDAAQQLLPPLRGHYPRDLAAGADSLPLVDVWNRHHEVFGSKLRSTDKHRATDCVATSQRIHGDG
jgi:hypothetical protein